MIPLKLYIKKKLSLLLYLMLIIPFSYAQSIPEEESPSCNEMVKNNKPSTIKDKKPTVIESWRKILTLKWKELNKADIWNISTPIAGICTLSLAYYYWPKNIPNNANHNPDHNNSNGDAKKNPALNNNQDNLNDSPNNNIPRPTLAQSINTAHLDKNEIFINDIQKNIALHMIADFFTWRKIFKEHQAEINAMAVKDDKLITTSKEGSINIWNIHNGQLLHILETPDEKWNDGFTKSYKLKISDHYVAIASDGMTDKFESENIINIWNINTGELIHTFEACDEIKSLTMNQDRLFAGVGGPGDSEIMIWNTHSGALLHKFKAHDNRIMSIAIQDNILVTGSDDNTAKIWSINDYKLLHILEGHAWWVNKVAIHDNKVITGSMDGTIRIWDKNNGQLLYTFEEHDSYINALAINDNKVISGSEDRTIKIWDINTGKVLHTLIGHTKGIAKVLIKGDEIISTAHDSTRTWDINTGQGIYTIPHQKNNDWHNIATCSSDTIITKSDKIVKIWPLYGDLNKPEFYDPDHALFWIKHNLLPLQANLISRISLINYKTTFFIDTHSEFNNLRSTDDMYIWLTFPTHVRNYLMSRLNIKLVQISQ